MTPERQFPLKWPAGWKRTQHPGRSKFDTSMERATRGLLDEVRKLGGRLPVISSNAKYRQDGLPYSKQGAIDDTGVAVYFERIGKPVVFACDAYWTLHENIHAIAKTIEALRGIERWGASDMLERAFTGFAALPAPIAAGMKRDWEVVLGLDQLIKPNAADVQLAYRRLAAQNHPDRGGDPEKMAELNQARDKALKELSP